jgi:hypothetical protein
VKIGFVGHESKGAWQIRAKQIAPFINARLDPKMSSLNYDLIILIKLPDLATYQRIKKAQVPVIWDVVDCWSQNQKLNMSTWDKESMLEWLKEKLEYIKPFTTIAATNVMSKDIESLGYKSKIIYHHSRPKIIKNPLRSELEIVGIEGSEFQYGSWGRKVKTICKNLNLIFKGNFDTSKDHLHKFDVVVINRDDNGYAVQNWKSNIKLSNAHASGTPGIFNREKGYEDVSSGYEQWADTEEEIVEAIEKLRSYDLRQTIHENFLKNTITLEQVAEEYKKFIASL